jgi:CRP/FNR family transcriptional regulator
MLWRGPVQIAREVELEQAEFFRALAPDRLVRVRAILREKSFTRQQVLFFAGQPAAYLWLVRRGEVRLYKSSRDGRLATLETLRPGQIFGALSALAEDHYPASAEGVTDGVAWYLPRTVVLRLLQEEPGLAVEILRIVSGRLREAQERLRSFAHDPAPARLAHALLRAAHHGEARVTRRALAEAAGTTVETAIRVLRRFERDGAIRGEVGRVHVLDEPELRRISGGFDA